MQLLSHFSQTTVSSVISTYLLNGWLASMSEFPHISVWLINVQVGIVLSHSFCSYTVSLCLLTLIALPRPHVSLLSTLPASVGKSQCFLSEADWKTYCLLHERGIFAPQKSQSQLYHYLLLSVHYSWSKKALEGAWELELLARQRSGSHSPPPPRIHILQGGFSSHLSLKTFLRGTVCPQVGIMLH